jgi:uncharacterized phage protein (TIGR02220 family)
MRTPTLCDYFGFFYCKKLAMSENFKGVFIPADIFLIKDLSLAEKILIVTILGLDNGSGCYASNEYLSKFVQITPTSCSGIISNLKKSGLLFEPKKFDGRKRYLSVNTNFLYDMPTINMDADLKKDLSSISNIERQTNEKDNAAYKKPEGSIKDFVRQPNENHNHINIDYNIVNNIDYNKEKTDFSFSENSKQLISLNDKKELEKVSSANFVNDKQSEPSESAKYFFEVTQVLALLTDRSGVKFVIPKTKSGIEKYEPYKLIKERISDGAKLEDIFAVVEMKNQEWQGTPIYKNFVPSTLFRKSNFDKYIQQVQISINNNLSNNQKSYNNGVDAKQQYSDFISKVLDFEL